MVISPSIFSCVVMKINYFDMLAKPELYYHSSHKRKTFLNYCSRLVPAKMTPGGKNDYCSNNLLQSISSGQLTPNMSISL